MGEKFHQFTSQGTEKMGESIGEVIGYFIPDLLLVVFSEGISELIEGALKAVRVVLEIGIRGSKNCGCCCRGASYIC